MGVVFSLVTTPEGDIVEWQGEPRKMLGVDPDSLTNTSVIDIFQEDERPKIRSKLFKGAELKPAVLKGTALRHESGGYIKVDLTFGPGQSGNVRLYFARPGEAVSVEEVAPKGRQRPVSPEGPVEVSGRREFFSKVEAALNDPNLENEARLLMLQISALTDAKVIQRLGTQGIQDLRASIESNLHGSSLEGGVGQLGPDSYSVLMDEGVTQDQISESIVEESKAHSVSEEELALRAHALLLDKPVDESIRLDQVLSYVEKQFSGRLEGALPNSLGEAHTNSAVTVGKVRSAIADREFDLSQRGLVELDSERASFRIIDAVLRVDGHAAPVTNFLNIEDYPDLALEHDLTVIGLSARHIAADKEESGSRGTPLLIETLEETLSQNHFQDSLEAILTGTGCEPDEIGFKLHHLKDAVTRPDVDASLVKLSQDGHFLWLDEFANALSGLGRLKKARNGFVEVPASYLVKLCEESGGAKTVGKLIDEWASSDFHIVATNIESEAEHKLVRRLGISYTLSDEKSAF